MNPIAYRTTGLAIKTLSNLSKAHVNIHNARALPQGGTIFVINHFTRIETFMMPYYIFRLIRRPVWSLAASELFVGAFGRYLETVGAVSTDRPDRDRLIVKSLLTGEAAWIIFPEGRMVKSKKIVEKGRYMISYAGGKHPPHTGAANLALRTEFYRQRLRHLARHAPQEAERLLPMFDLDSLDAISDQGTTIVPVNLTYYPVRARENILSRMADRLVNGLPERLSEELMTEGAMLLSGVDIDIRFGAPIDIKPYLDAKPIIGDICSARPFDLDDPLPCIKCMRQSAFKIMQRYMDAIYRMTTVNYDHVFASLLKHSPTRRIRREDFKRRAYLAVTREIDDQRLHRHHSLEADQVHLLTDDRFSRWSDFIGLAIDKRVVEEKGELLHLQRKTLRRSFDFHRVRIDNPVGVIANEAEPMVGLQRRLSRLAWTPGWWLRKRIARDLLRGAIREFEQDYTRFYIEKETKPKHVGAPVLRRGRRGWPGVVLSHGYMAAPAEVEQLAIYLNRRGFWVYTPRLKGHGTSPEDLATRSYQDWILSMEQGYVLMRQMCRRVVVGGFSTGAALALELATRVDGLAGVFAVSTPLRLQYLTSRLAPAVNIWNRMMKRVHLEEARKEFVDNNPENPHINYMRNPIHGVNELERLMGVLEPRLGDITIPALVMQSQEDPVVHPKGSERIFRLLGSDDKQFILFNFKRHGILLGSGAERVYRAIGHFLDHLNAPAAITAEPVVRTEPLP